MILNIRDRWAYDISKNVISDGEVRDEQVISQSIELIIATMFGERLFNPFFGSPLHSFLAEGVTRKTADRLLNSVLNAIRRWESRITIIEDRVELFVSADGNSISLTIPYSINKSQIVSVFKKKIIF